MKRSKKKKRPVTAARSARDDGRPDARKLVWRQLAAFPNRDNGTLALVCAEEDVIVDRHYCSVIKARWRNTLRVLHEAGYKVPMWDETSGTSAAA
jgi:hypothetical protein